MDKTTFRVNKDFEKRYNHNKKREELAMLKNKYGEIDEEDSSSSESMDEELVMGKKEDI